MKKTEEKNENIEMDDEVEVDLYTMTFNGVDYLYDDEDNVFDINTNEHIGTLENNCVVLFDN